MKKYMRIFLVVLMFLPTFVAAVDFNQSLTAQDKQQLDQILSPVMNIYNFIKYAAVVIGVLMLVFAGVEFITSGGESAKKERAKNMAAGVIIGLIVIWVAPLVVKFFYRI